MNFDFSDDQRTIKDTARELLANRAPLAKVREAAEAGRGDDALWRELGELGWPGIAVGEEHGGQALGVVELAVLAEELGLALAPVPLLGSALAALAIEHAGSDAQRERWLPGLAAGELTGGFGPAGLLADGPGAGVLVVLDSSGGAAIVEGGAEPIDAIDPTRRYGRVERGGEPLEGDVGGALDRAAAVVAAEVVGVSQRALEMTLAYVKDRKQFGVPVGSFQAVQHRCAQMLLHTEGARSTAYFAAWAADAAPERLAEAAGMARAAAIEAGREVTAAAIQMHGGIGFTWEADIHWMFKRAQVDAALLGGAKEHRARLAAILADRARGLAAA